MGEFSLPYLFFIKKSQHINHSRLHFHVIDPETRSITRMPPRRVHDAACDPKTVSNSLHSSSLCRLFSRQRQSPIYIKSYSIGSFDPSFFYGRSRRSRGIRWYVYMVTHIHIYGRNYLNDNWRNPQISSPSRTSHCKFTFIQ